MLHGDQNNRIGLSLAKLFLDVSHSVRVIRNAIREAILEIVRRHHDRANVNMAVLKVVPNVDDVSGEKVTTTGNLNLYANPGNPIIVAVLVVFADIEGRIGKNGVNNAGLQPSQNFEAVRIEKCPVGCGEKRLIQPEIPSIGGGLSSRVFSQATLHRLSRMVWGYCGF